ncbi:MAG: hypothetical protein ACTSQJ_09540 [Promethearchaeota archaeon]
MILQNDIQIPEYIYTINFILGIINLTISILIFLYLLNRVYSEKEADEIKIEKRHRINLITWALFFLLIIIANIILTIYAIQTINNPSITERDPLVEKIGIVLIYSAFFIKIIYIEYVINDLKFYKGYYFSIAFLGVIIFIIFMDLEAIKQISTIHYIFLVMLFFSYSIIPVLYLYLSIKTVGDSRKNAFKVCVGTTMFGLGAMAGPLNLKGYYGISEFINFLITSTLITGPITVIIATLIIFDSFRKKERT